MQLYLLRRHFGITAYHARHVMEVWERDLLLEGLQEEFGVEDETPKGNAFARAPELGQYLEPYE